MTRRSIKNPIGVVFYNEEKDQISFETFPTQPGITIRLTEAAGVCMAMAQWFLGQLPLTSSRDTKDIEDTLREAAKPPTPKRQPFILRSTPCLCGHMNESHLGVPRRSCGIVGCKCTEFRRADLG